MARFAVLVLALLAAPAAHAAVLRGKDGEKMRPDVVANTLLKVEEEWRKLAADFTESADVDVAKSAPDSFGKSCATVVAAVIQGSGGDRNVAKEYMSKVCSQKVLAGWHATRCSALASKITEHAMLADQYANRENLKPAKVCTSFWSVFVEAEKNREAEEAKERAEKEKVHAEEEKKAAAAAVEAKKKADAEAKIEAEKKAKEEAERAEVEKELKAKQEAAEAKARAAEAAARLAEKKAEAEKIQKEAQIKLEEAKEAEKEHAARQAEHEKAEEVLKQAAKAAPKVVTPPKPVEAQVAGPPPLSPPADAAMKKAAPAAKPVAATEAAKAPEKVAVAKVEPAPAAKAAVAPQTVDAKKK